MNAFAKLLCSLIILAIGQTSLQGAMITDVEVPETIVLRADENLGIIYSHQLKKNQTIFGLAKFFNTDMARISAANPSVDLASVQLDQKINIPINTAMITSERNLSPHKSYIPVFYTVKAQDNLFRISKVYFHQSIENVMNINNLKSMDLSIGQKILVGWYQYDEQYKERLAWKEKGIEVETTGEITKVTPHSTTPIVAKSEPAKSSNPTASGDNPVFQKKVNSSHDVVAVEKRETQGATGTTPPKVNNPTAPAKEIASDDSKPAELQDNTEEEAVNNSTLSSDPFENRNGIYEGKYEGKPTIHSAKIRAEWNMTSKDKVNLFALHATAKVNSYIEIYNPMLDRKVIAKVVGNLPPKAHKKNVDLIISPKVAETLGAVDKRFYVQVRYID